MDKKKEGYEHGKNEPSDFVEVLNSLVKQVGSLEGMMAQQQDKVMQEFAEVKHSIKALDNRLKVVEADNWHQSSDFRLENYLTSSSKSVDSMRPVMGFDDAAMFESPLNAKPRPITDQ